MILKKSFVIFILLSLVIWQLCASLSKIIVFPYINIDNPVFSITKLTNNGAAFGTLENNPYILGILGIFVIIYACIAVYRKVDFQNKAKILYCAIFVSGILGNTFERFKYGYVNDFIKINLFDFPVFNLFDILICTSIILLIWGEIKFGK